MKTLRHLPHNGLKPISKEAIARCVIAETGDTNLAEKVRSDSSFDVAISTSAIVEIMEVELFRYTGKVPMFDSYCGTAIQKALAKTPYDLGYEFSSSVRI